MARDGGATRRRIIDSAYELFYRDGFSRSGVDAIAKAAKVTKRTLYYHFNSKDALLAAVLEAQHQMALQRVQRWAGRGGDNPVAMVNMIFSGFATWARRPGWRGSGFTRSAMELADLPGHPARAAAHRHKAAVEEWLATRFAQSRLDRPRQTARQLTLLLEGCLSLVLIHGDIAYVTEAASAAQVLVSQSRTGTAHRNPGRA